MVQTLLRVYQKLDTTLTISSDNSLEKAFTNGDTLNRFVKNITEWNGTGHITISAR